ncbi:MAG: glycosyltransferase family 39 protein [Candidatus Staskawiczbacteria bacterium]|jgi:Gpi18-like mannosyltransferase
MKIKEYISKIPKEIVYILQLFFLTRFILAVIGVTALGYSSAREHYSSYKIFNVWGLWDTRWYLNIAKMGYSAKIDAQGYANYGFFPLYPLFIKIFNFIFQNYFASALIVSNLFLILAAIFLYKLTRLDCDEEISLRTVKYLFVFPAAFLLSAALSESLFLFLIIVCFYYLKKQKWFLSGIFGMLLTLTKPFGIIMLVPAIYEYIAFVKANKKIGFLKIIKDACSILLIPIGLALFAVYTYFLTGDIFAYTHIKQSGWGNYLANPIKLVYSSLTSGFTGYVFGAEASIFIIFLLIFFWKKINFSYFLAAIMLVGFCVFYNGTMPSALRYYTALFPVYIILGKISENKKIDDALMIFFLLLQGFLMAFWTIQSGIII